jgi:carbon storage regulator
MIRVAIPVKKAYVSGCPPYFKDKKMLVLSRRAGGTLVIGENIKVIVLGVNGDQIRFGIDAPRDVAVHRKEIWLRIREQSRAQKRPPNPG